ncbi:MAG: DUF262 domain-containing protein [Spirulinaceae cyanobacterium]
MSIASTETKMWDKSPSRNSNSKMTEEEINAKYDKGHQRILTEMNREKLPSFVEALQKPGHMDFSPFYQRRSRWDDRRQSLLIESFLCNIPVPPIILYSDEKINLLENIFIETINVADKVYQGKLFKPFDPKSSSWKDKSYKAYYDAVMVGFSRHLKDAELLVERKSRIIEETQKIFKADSTKLFTGSGKTKADLQKRIQLSDEMLSKIIAE